MKEMDIFKGQGIIEFSRGFKTEEDCKKYLSPSAGTLFHKVKFGLLKAFHICFEMDNIIKDIVNKTYNTKLDKF